MLCSALSSPPPTTTTLPLLLGVSCSLSFFSYPSLSCKSCFVLCGGLWKRASSVKVGQRGGIGEEGVREREGGGYSEWRAERERGRKEGGREGGLRHMPLLCKLEQTSQREALSCCCLRGQVSRTHSHTHTHTHTHTRTHTHTHTHTHTYTDTHTHTHELHRRISLHQADVYKSKTKHTNWLIINH